MIKYKTHSEVDKSKWDDCIRNSPNGLIYAYSWYLDLASPGWDALVEDDYNSAFPLTRNKKFGTEYLYPPFFIQQLGLFSKNKITGTKLNEFLKAIPGKFRFIEINLNTENNFDTPGFYQKKNLTHHLNLNQPYQKIYENYSENLKRNLKKAESFEQKILHDTNPGYVIMLFRMNRGKEITKIKNRHFDAFEKIIEKAGNKNLLTATSAVINNKETLAGTFFIESNAKAIFIFSGSIPASREHNSMALLMDAFIKDHAGKNLILDFEGSNDLNLARFYKSFGAKEMVYLQIKKNKLPYPVRFFKK